jgi:hypothetical protein
VGDRVIGEVHGRARVAHPTTYRGLLGGFLLSLALTLLTLVDFRRGFLFAEYPFRSLFYAFNPLHAAMLAAGIAGMFACYRGLRTRGRREKLKVSEGATSVE